MSDQLPFLQQILDDAEDDAPRLVFADWLEEQGDPRGEFIRVQCALASEETRPTHRPKLRKREQELYRKNWREWSGDIRTVLRKPVFRRGFLDEGTLSVRDFIKHAAHLMTQHPLRHVTLTAGAKLLPDLASLPELRRLSTLRLPQNGFRDDAITAFANSPNVNNIEKLVLYHQAFRQEGLEALAASTHFRSLKSLDLSLNSQVGHGFSRLAEAPFLPQLRELLLRDCLRRVADFRVFSQLAPLQSLEVLDVSGNFYENRSSADGAAELVSTARTFPALRHLSLDSITMTSRGLEHLANSTRLSAVKILELRWNDIGDDGVLALARSPLLAQLERIGLSGNQITRAGAEALATSPHWSRGTQLMLSKNNIHKRSDIALLQERYGKTFGHL